MLKAAVLTLSVLLAVAAPVRAQEVVARGTFQDAGDHDAEGGVQIIRQGVGYQVVLGEDFSMDRAPDPYVAFGSADAFTPGTDFAQLESRSGVQSYAVPAGIDPTRHQAVWLWCRRFAVPLGVARLQ